MNYVLDPCIIVRTGNETMRMWKLRLLHQQRSFFRLGIGSLTRIASVAVVCMVLTACSLRPTTPVSDLLPTRTVASRPVETITPESLETRTPPTADSSDTTREATSVVVPTATRRARVTPTAELVTTSSSILSPLNVDQIEDQWSVSDAYMTYIYAASTDLLGVSTSQGYKLVDAKTLDVIQSTRLDVTTRSKSMYFWAISPNALYAGHLDEDGSMSIYDLRTSDVVTSLQFSPVISLALADIGFNPDGSVVTVANGSVQRYDTSTGKTIGAQYPLPPTTRSVMVMRDGVYVAAFTNTDIILINALSSKTVKLTAAFGVGQSRYVRSAPDNSLMFAGDASGHVAGWDPITGQKKYEKNFGEKVDVAPGPHGQYLAVIYQDGVAIESIADQKELAQIRLKGGASPFSAQFDPEGKTLFVTSISSIESFTVPAGTRDHFVSILPIRNVAFTYDSQYLVSWVGGDSPGLAILDAATGHVISAFSHPAKLSQVMVGSVSDKIAVATAYGAIYVWTLISEEPVVDIPASSTVGHGLLGFAHDDADLVYVAGNQLVVFSIASGVSRTLPLPVEVGAIGYAGKSGFVAVSDVVSAQVVNLTGKKVSTLEKATGLVQGFSFVFSPDEKYLAGNTSDEVRVWEVNTGKLLSRVTEKKSLIAPAIFTPDSAAVVIKYGDSAELLNIQTGSVTSLAGPVDHSFNLAYSPDMQLTATGTYIDFTTPSIPNYRLGEFGVWSTGTQKHLVQFSKLLPIYFVQFSPDGTRVVTTSPNGEIVMWGLPAQ